MSRPLELVTTSPAQTHEVAGVVASAVALGDVVALTGELGAGKTCFVQGAAAALGVTERVTSPSFILRKEYDDGRLPLLHMDVYRLESLQEVMDVGFGEALDRQRVTFVEWGDAMAPLLPTDHLEVELRLPELNATTAASAASAADWEPEPRRLLLWAHGPSWSRRLAELYPRLRPWVRTEEES